MTILPLSQFRSLSLQPIFREEVADWKLRLDWDYREPQQVVAGMVDAGSLAGFVAVANQAPAGFTFYLIQGSRVLVGCCTVLRSQAGGGIEEALLEAVVRVSKANANVKRIEAQFISFAEWPRERFFSHHQFTGYLRNFMRRDCAPVPADTAPAGFTFAPLAAEDVEAAALLTTEAYAQSVDREISSHYQSLEDCHEFLSNLIFRPGCGNYLPEVSFACQHAASGQLAGFVVTSTVAPGHGHIPQVAVSPPFQGRGLGRHLLSLVLGRLASRHYQSISLTVTAENRPAVRLYRQLGFVATCQFPAFVWNRLRS